MVAKGTRKPKGKKEALSAGERRRLGQLVVCLALFAIVFVGRGVDLGPVSQLSSTVGTLVRTNTDFQAVFSRLEGYLSQEEAQQTQPGGEDGAAQGT